MFSAMGSCIQVSKTKKENKKSIKNKKNKKIILVGLMWSYSYVMFPQDRNEIQTWTVLVPLLLVSSHEPVWLEDL
jgi:hypothetical protein